MSSRPTAANIKTIIAAVMKKLNLGLTLTDSAQLLPTNGETGITSKQAASGMRERDRGRDRTHDRDRSSDGGRIGSVYNGRDRGLGIIGPTTITDDDNGDSMHWGPVDTLFFFSIPLVTVYMLPQIHGMRPHNATAYPRGGDSSLQPRVELEPELPMPSSVSTVSGLEAVVEKLISLVRIQWANWSS